MNLNNFIDNGKKKSAFKATVKNGSNILKFFVDAYTEKEAKENAVKRLKQDHPEMDSKKILIKKL